MFEERRIAVRTASSSILAEGADPTYKDVDKVSKVGNNVGIATYMARLVPLAVVKN